VATAWLLLWHSVLAHEVVAAADNIAATRCGLVCLEPHAKIVAFRHLYDGRYLKLM
jgi:hypothetical protein